jgi:hypothetical protein
MNEGAAFAALAAQPKLGERSTGWCPDALEARLLGRVLRYSQGIPAPFLTSGIVALVTKEKVVFGYVGFPNGGRLCHVGAVALTALARATA